MIRSTLILSLMSLTVAVILVTPCYAKIDPATAVAIYLFDEEKADEFRDYSGREHVGIFQGGRGEWEDGKFGSAINTVGGWIRVESADDLHPIDQWTVVAWFSIENVTGHHTMVTKWDEYLLRVDTPGEGGNISCFVKPGGNWEPRAMDGAPKTEEWMHAAMVWNNDDNGALRLYIDGVKAAQSSRQGKIAGNQNPLCIGSQTGGWLFPGLIDDVGIFNVALEEEDIRSIMENGLKAAVFGRLSVDSHVGLAITWAEIKSN